MDIERKKVLELESVSDFEEKLKNCIASAITTNERYPNPETKAERDEVYKYLNELKKVLGDYRLIEYSGLSDALFAGIYFSRKLLEDIWENLGGDSSFGFEVVIMSENYGPLQKNLFLFWNALINSKPDALEHMTHTIKYYLRLLTEMEERVKKEGKNVGG